MPTKTSIPATLKDLAVPIDDVKPHPRNVREGDIGAIAESLEYHGQYRPIVVSKKRNVILAGNHTWKAAKALGWETIAVTYVDVTKAQEDRILLIDNRSNDLASYDEAGLADLLSELAGTDDALAGTGYDGDDLDQLLQDIDAEPFMKGREGKVIGPPENPTVEVGDIWLLGDHILAVGDATDQKLVDRIKTLMDTEPAMMVTDPPYGVEYDPSWRSDAGMNGPKDSTRGGDTSVRGREVYVPNDDRADWSEAFALWNPPVMYVWHGAAHAVEVGAGLIDIGYDIRGQLIWVKPNAVISRGHYSWQHEPCFYAVAKGETANWQKQPGLQSTVWEGSSPITTAGADDMKTPHPTQKPVGLMEYQIRNHTEPGDWIVDCFGGSGSTLAAAENIGRRCAIIELNPGYAEVIKTRYESLNPAGDVEKVT